MDGSRVFVLTSYLRIVCLEAATGQEVWSRDLIADFNSSVIQYQNAASPLIVDDLILMNCNAPTDGHLLALHKQDGSTAWRNHTSAGDRMTHASPIHTTLAGTPQVIFFVQTGLLSVAPTNGAFLWRHSFFTYPPSIGASPVVGGNVVYGSAAYGRGSGAVGITNNGGSLTTSQIWRRPGANMNHWATPVHHEGFLYGIYGETFMSMRCVDLATGLEKWAHDLDADSDNDNEGGGVLLVSGHILVLTDFGTLVLVKPDPYAYTEVARFTALDGTLSGKSVVCWNIPAISNGRIYVRSTVEAACFDVSLPNLKLQSVRAGGTGDFQLLVGNGDGSPLDTNRAARIDVLATSDLELGPAGWTHWPQPAVLTNGQLRVADPQSSTIPRRFFKAQERP